MTWCGCCPRIPESVLAQGLQVQTLKPELAQGLQVQTLKPELAQGL